LQDTYIR